MSESTNVVVLFSGGIDSLLCAFLAERDEHRPFTALTIDYGQTPDEIGAAGLLCERYAWFHMLAEVTPFPCSLDPAGTNLILGRNAMFLSLATSVLPAAGGRIYIGSNADDHRDYPDCRGEFFTAFENMCSSQGLRVAIMRPLLNLTKREVISQVRKRGGAKIIDDTVSCYRGKPACGLCNACKLRQAAL